jgi:hypothetical protein
MYSTVRVYRGAGGLADALVQNQAEVEKLIGGIDGFNGYYLIKTADGAVSISVFETQAGADESTRLAANWVKENITDMSVPAPDVSTGEVVISFSS